MDTYFVLWNTFRDSLNMYMVKFIVLKRKLSCQTGRASVIVSLSDQGEDAQVAVYPFYALCYRMFYYLER